jgi:hypothetical protein
LALEPVDCWTTQVGPHRRPCGAPDRPYFSMRSHLCSKSSGKVYIFARKWLFWIRMEPGWAVNGSRFDPTAHNFTSKAVWANLRGVVLVDIDNLACKHFVSRFFTHLWLAGAGLYPRLLALKRPIPYAKTTFLGLRLPVNSWHIWVSVFCFCIYTGHLLLGWSLQGDTQSTGEKFTMEHVG